MSRGLGDVYKRQKYLRVLYEFYHRLLLSRGFAMADESPIQVLKEEGREATARRRVL